MGDVYSLEVPESVSIRYEVAGLGTRFLAALIDAAIQLVVLLALAIAAWAAGSALQGVGGYALAGLGLLIINVVLLGYYIVFEITWNGQTPGKRAIGLRVLATNGYPASPLSIVVRNVLRLVDFLPASYAVGVIVLLANRRARRLGDLMAGTMVVKEGRDGSLRSLNPSSRSEPVGAAPWPGVAQAVQSALVDGAQLHLLTREDEALIDDFMRRRASLSAGRRDELARQIVGLVHQHIGGPSPLLGYPAPPPETYLEAVAAARRAAHTTP